MIDISYTIRGFDIEKYLINLEKNISVENVVKKVHSSIIENVTAGKNYDGTEPTPLKPSTIRRKHSSRVFYDSGTLINEGIKYKMINQYHGQVFVAAVRNTIVGILEAGKAPLAGARYAFGLSKMLIEELKNMTISAIKNSAG